MNRPDIGSIVTASTESSETNIVVARLSGGLVGLFTSPGYAQLRDIPTEQDCLVRIVEHLRSVCRVEYVGPEYPHVVLPLPLEKGVAKTNSESLCIPTTARGDFLYLRPACPALVQHIAHANFRLDKGAYILMPVAFPIEQGTFPITFSDNLKLVWSYIGANGLALYLLKVTDYRETWSIDYYTSVECGAASKARIRGYALSYWDDSVGRIREDAVLI